ncbi:MAG: hypothetical protein DKM50_09905 [Candidatus Margulisiibacteriota bacterium]|nr:MAG: hypothetical protein A2X43_03990 [Candidatus Margulisbacteria bacterium GWD2_39_127]OGI05163.1 MAG: hypothetical protein A2X42_02500 [Candidatus Margulisbacteria bacterium GWF2_38_17]OGI06212.1 MAG: hypothetical protein A2X41_08080 [Candidatus Margulisbacteria bacterium GWE2_39_32]PZM78868.1 MAG: hypothetical protein DKM50_09905 [Candidatus Margulisiibacteriota bacterium]HAR64552.1 hypothetical protein [Candidatus Margulisiibacteriota bacterium]
MKLKTLIYKGYLKIHELYDAKLAHRDNHIKIILVLALLAIFSYLFLDVSVSKFFMLKRVIKASDFMIGFSSLVTTIMTMGLISIFLYRYKNGLNLIATIWLCMSLALLIIVICKAIFMRPRPYESLNITFLGWLHWGSSFPSVAGIYFVMVPFLWKLWKYDMFFALTPFIIHSISRIYVGQHYLSDVLAGIAIGYYIGYVFFIKTESRLFS